MRTDDRLGEREPLRIPWSRDADQLASASIRTFLPPQEDPSSVENSSRKFGMLRFAARMIFREGQPIFESGEDMRIAGVNRTSEPGTVAELMDALSALLQNRTGHS